MKRFLSFSDEIRKVLASEDDVLFAYLFGSAAACDTIPQSDIDLAIYLRPSSSEQYLKREAELTGAFTSALRRPDVDVHILNALPHVLQYEVLKEGTLILCKDPLERVEFETRMMLRFFELKPYIEEYRSLLIERIRNA